MSVGTVGKATNLLNYSKISRSGQNINRGIHCSSVEKIILLIVLMYREPSGSVTFSLVRGGTTSLVKYLNAGLGDWMAS